MNHVPYITFIRSNKIKRLRESSLRHFIRPKLGFQSSFNSYSRTFEARTFPCLQYLLASLVKYPEAFKPKEIR